MCKLFGSGGGGGPLTILIILVSVPLHTMVEEASLSEVLLTDTVLSELMLLKYSDGLMRLLESALPLKLGGMKGRTRCLLTKLGECLSLSSPFVSMLMIVKSEHEELSLLEAVITNK